ncbi:MAG: CRISPR system precrRNA processing endoribonuclease RAMP protein Cas6 [Magnetococcales bacterium]|nr:CRISPR system precrRNA processing endoribonuclease RAMP protein Cas6 [Magnetococcales bacterium]
MAEIRGRGNLAWRDWTRRSGRQRQLMALGGVVGRWTLSGPLEAFWPFLYLGEWLHVGKNATFGLGGYRLEGPG